MILFGLFLLVLSSLLGVYMYALFYKSRYRISDSLSFTVTLAAGQITSFVIAMTLYLVFPIDFTVICTVNLWIGIVIGTQFSSVTRKQSVLAGFFNGGVAAVMGTMVGAVYYRSDPLRFACIDPDFTKYRHCGWDLWIVVALCHDFVSKILVD